MLIFQANKNNAEVTPKGRVSIRNELLEIKQENNSEEIVESASSVVNIHTEVHVKHERDVASGQHDVQLDSEENIMNSLQKQIIDLSEKKKTLIESLVSSKSENQELYLDLKKQEAMLHNKIEVERKLEISVKSIEEKYSLLSTKYDQLNLQYTDLNAEKQEIDKEFQSHLLKCEKELFEYKQTIARLTDEKNTLIERNQPVSSSSDNDSDAAVYDVHEILAHKIRNRKRYFLVRWEGFGAEEDTWEPEQNLRNLLAFKQYLKKNAM